jgi:nicotinamide phosphoribosyltransferase
MKTTPLFFQDCYKISNSLLNKPGTTKVYSNLTPRKFMDSNQKFTTLFGVQYMIKRYFIEEFNEWFSLSKEEAVLPYKRYVEAILGREFDASHIEKLHSLGYLPLHIKTLDEGTMVPSNVPVLTITNTLPEFYWLVNFLETLISNTLWYPSTSAANTKFLKDLMISYAKETCDDISFVDYQLCDFSLRGHHSNDSGTVYGGAWATSFKGSDTFPSMMWLEKYYNANINETICSVTASEHATAGSFGSEEELDYTRHMIESVPSNAIVSIVADTWNYPKFVTKLLPKLKDLILSREGKVVIRPDSFWSNPQDCLCGYEGWNDRMDGLDKEEIEMVRKGTVQTLYEMFGGNKNSKGYIEINPKISVIYGEGMFHDRLDEICRRLKEKGFASNNFVGGVGSYSALSRANCGVTRDCESWAMKCTAVENKDGLIEVFKDPITDSGMKKSLKGLLKVYKEDGIIKVKDQCTHAEESEGLLQTVFLDGKLVRETTLSEIRNRLK